MRSNLSRRVAAPLVSEDSEPAAVEAKAAVRLAVLPGTARSAQKTPGAHRDGVPDYMLDVYDWCYVRPERARLLDRNLVVKVLLFLQDGRLMRAVLDEIAPGMRVWMVAHVYGDLVGRMAGRTGAHGAFDLTDVTPVQAEHARAKLAGFSWASVHRTDAAQFGGEAASYDLICSFMLMHEIPEQKKRELVANMLAKLSPQGKIIFVDYHRPAWWQPVRWILKLVNHYLEPYAHALWTRELSDYADDAAAFRWKKTLFFGGVYQLVEVSRR